MINNSKEKDFLILNPDTLWNEDYVGEVKKMQNLYFLKKMNCTLLIVNKILSFDDNLKGDFSFRDNLLRNDGKDFIFIGCQILNRNLFKDFKVENFSISEIWNELLKKNELNGYESFNKFFHLTNLETFKKLRDL